MNASFSMPMPLARQAAADAARPAEDVLARLADALDDALPRSS